MADRSSRRTKRCVKLSCIQGIVQLTAYPITKPRNASAWSKGSFLASETPRAMIYRHAHYPKQPLATEIGSQANTRGEWTRNLDSAPRGALKWGSARVNASFSPQGQVVSCEIIAPPEGEWGQRGRNVGRRRAWEPVASCYAYLSNHAGAIIPCPRKHYPGAKTFEHA